MTSISAVKPSIAPTTAAIGLAMLLALQPASTDIYLPALPALTKALAAPMVLAQLTMSVLILAFGFGQLFWGPVADRVGRRPALQFSLSLFAAASMAATLASGIEWLVVWRGVQGFTMAGAVVCARAMVRDLYEPHEGAQVMALALSGLGLVAIGGPILGGVVAAWWGWRATLLTVTLYGALTLVFVSLRLPETLAHKNPQATALGPMFATWARIARHPGFIAWTLLVACTYGGLFTQLAGSSFIYIDLLGVAPGTYGAVMGVGAASYLAGTLVCRRWIQRAGAIATVARGAGFTLAGGAAMAVLAFVDQPSMAPVLLAQCVYMFGHGFHVPCAQTGAVAPFPRNAGAASALAGFVLALVAFGVGRWLGVALDGTLAPYALTVGFWALLTSSVAWTLVRWHGSLA